MNAFFLAWTKKARHAVVWNGSAWVDSPTEITHRQRAKLYPPAEAREKIHSLRVRFGGVDEITLVPVATVQDVSELAEKLPRKGRR